MAGRTRTTLITGLVALVAVTLGPSARLEPIDRVPAGGDARAEADRDARAGDARATAKAEAQRTGRPVEIPELRTETTRVYANPSGTLTVEAYARPVRVERDGAWAPIDPTLTRQPDGTILPAATVVDIRLSGGGDTELVRLSRPDDPDVAVRLGWPTTLPTPVLDGASATYPEVFAGVDLVVTVDADGFRQVLVVKDPQAAQNPALRRLRFPLRADGLSLRTTPDGTTIATDSAGQPVFVAATPVMWESPSEGRLPRHATLATRYRDGSLVITPDTTLLTSPDTRFPVYIDPSFAGPEYLWTHVNATFGDQSYWNYDREEGAKVGYSNWESPSVTYRSFFQMDLGALAGTRIHNAYFAITLDHTPSGSPTPVDLWHTRPIDPAQPLTWNNSAGHWLDYLATASGHAWTGGGEPNMGMEFASESLTSVVQSVADSGSGVLTLGLRAPDEGNRYQWKRFLPDTARIVVEYNTPPTAPLDLTLTNPVACGTAERPTPIATTQPQFAATAHDRDGDNLTTRLRIYDTAGKLVYWVDSATTTSGSRFSWPAVPAGVLQEGGTYRVNAYSTDDTDTGPPTPDCVITIDTDAPGTPTISSMDFPDGEPEIVAGTTGTVTFHPASPDDDVVEYAYGFEQDRITMRVKAGPDGTATVPITVWPHPDTGIPNLRLYVQAIDAAGNISGITPAWDLSAYPNPSPPPQVRGDTNGDGRADLTAVIDQGYERTTVWNLIAHEDGFHTGVIAFDTGARGGFPLYRTRTASGDVDGDGKTDLVMLREEPGRTVALYLLRSDGNRYRAESSPLWTSDSGWVLSALRVLTGDVDGDGAADVVVQRDTGGGSWQALIFRGPELSSPTTWAPSGASGWPVSTPVLADIDGDGMADLVSMRDAGGCRTVTQMWRATGAGFASTAVTLHDHTGWCASRATLTVGDVDGDGRDDIVAMYDHGTADTAMWVFRSTGTALRAAEWWRAPGELDAVKARIATGDYDLDGRDDLAVFYSCCAPGSRQVYTLTSTGAGFTGKALRWQQAMGAATGPAYGLEHRSYELVARHSRKCLEVEAADTGDQAIFQQWDCNGGLHQRFRPVRAEGADYVALKPVHSVKCADVFSFQTQDGAAIVQWPCTEYLNQQITLEYVESAGYETVVRLRFGHSGKCAGVTGGELGNGADVVQQTCSGAAEQQWILRHAYQATQLDGRYRIASENGGNVLDVTDCRTQDGADVRMWYWISTSPCMKWTVRPLGDDVYEIIDTNSGKLLTITGCGTGNGATVALWPRDGSNCQRWRIEPARDGAYTIFAVNSGKSLDVAGCDPDPGADVIIWPYWGGSCQRWIFTPM